MSVMAVKLYSIKEHLVIATDIKLCYVPCVSVWNLIHMANCWDIFHSENTGNEINYC